MSASAATMSELPFVVALDGPAGSGKSTVGVAAAMALGLGYFDTGLLYRALTWLAQQRGIDAADGQSLAQAVSSLGIDVDPRGRVWRDGTDITDQLQQPRIDAAVSAVSAHVTVREAMLPAQRSLIRPPGLIMAGRDIGTVIVPEAPLKIWLSASASERARRRAVQTGEDYASVLDALHRRDVLDASRRTAPMARAQDAVAIDTDGLEPAQVVDCIVELAHARGAKARPQP